jgi:uncharacterized protein (DUF305 family)
MRIPRALAALTLGLTLALAGCGDDEPVANDGSTSRTDHNDADVAFASDMIQHHAQALAMVDLTVERELDPDVQQIVDQIRSTQVPEIETMTDWLVEWDEPIPATVNDHLNADGDHDMGDMEGMDGDDTGMDMPGMMSDGQMADLEAAGDAEFQDLFLTMMIEHHEGAIEMAQTEQDDGQYSPAVSLAEEIEAAQAAEIETMQGLLS